LTEMHRETPAHLDGRAGRIGVGPPSGPEPARRASTGES
jgi:hypothetical protein